MDPMDVLLGQNRDATAVSGLADALRKRKEVASLALLSGDPTSQKFGGGLYSDVESQMNARIKQDENQKQRDLTQGYYNQMAEQQGLSRALQEKELNEMIRHHKALEDATLQKAMAKAYPTRAPSVAAQKRAGDAIGNYNALRGARDSFKDDYGNNSGIPWEGEVSNTIGKLGIGTQDQKDQALWWQNYRNQYELGARHTLFGAALTDNEIAKWDQANISPSSTPEQIKRALNNMVDVHKSVLQRIHDEDTANYNPAWVEAAYRGLDLSGAPAPEGAPPATGEYDQEWSSMQ
jgi:hypothetical protein